MRCPGFIIAALLLMAAPVAAWTPSTLPVAETDQGRLERLDKALLPIQGALLAAFDDLSLAPGTLEAAYLDIIQTRAIQAWEIVRLQPWAECSAQYVATLRVGYALIADSIDSYRVKDQVFREELSAGQLLLGDRATLERNATTCGSETIGGPSPSPGHTPEPTPGST